MKKVVFILTLILITVNLFSQSQISYVKTTKYQAKETDDNWSGWKDVEGEIVIYFDMGFGFISITNTNIDRFILNTIEDEEKSEKGSIFTFNAIDDNGTNCKLVSYFGDDNIMTFTIIYSNIQYSYLISDEYEGYPFHVFKNEKNKKNNDFKIGKYEI